MKPNYSANMSLAHSTAKTTSSTMIFTIPMILSIISAKRSDQRPPFLHFFKFDSDFSFLTNLLNHITSQISDKVKIDAETLSVHFISKYGIVSPIHTQHPNFFSVISVDAQNIIVSVCEREKEVKSSDIEQVFSFSLPDPSQTQDVPSVGVSDHHDNCTIHVTKEDIEDTESDEDDEDDEDYLPTHLRTTTFPNNYNSSLTRKELDSDYFMDSSSASHRKPSLSKKRDVTKTKVANSISQASKAIRKRGRPPSSCKYSVKELEIIGEYKKIHLEDAAHFKSTLVKDLNAINPVYEARNTNPNIIWLKCSICERYLLRFEKGNVGGYYFNKNLYRGHSMNCHRLKNVSAQASDV
ncbi:hypothetical protein FGO68_gene747 [Halteria grandinella]|uniref:Uncharacterized protein n=1 Tax=Halteria grandinella TaxID=5974 RepID=A0A8J8NNA6_HALGN|nr:hypothetical protein FGO68_gene747 [Halteria grandinella]